MDKVKHDMEDILRMLLESDPHGVNSVRLVASNLSNLPPLGIDNMDILKLYQEFESVKAAVHVIGYNQKVLHDLVNRNPAPCHSTEKLYVKYKDIGVNTTDTGDTTHPSILSHHDKRPRHDSTVPVSDHVAVWQVSRDTSASQLAKKPSCQPGNNRAADSLRQSHSANIFHTLADNSVHQDHSNTSEIVRSPQSDHVTVNSESDLYWSFYFTDGAPSDGDTTATAYTF